MSLESGLILYAVDALIGTRNFNENSGLSDNSRGKKSPDWMTRVWEFATDWFAKGYDYLMSNFAGIFTSAFMTIWQFDFAATDKMIKDDIDQTNKGFAETLGRMGASAVFRSTGLGLTNAARMKYPTIDPSILAELDEENSEELKGQLLGGIAAIRSGLTRNAMNLTYMSGRQLLGKSPKEYTQPWSFAGQVENFAEWLEKTLPFNIGTFFKGAIEQFEDDFFDGLVMVGSAVQQNYAMSKAAIRDAQGKERIIKYYPDKNDESQFTFIAGRDEEIRQSISTAMIQNASMENLSVGMVVQTTLDSSMKSTMGLRLITIYYNMSESGGSTLPNGKRAPQKHLEIKNVKTNVDYDKIKLHCKRIEGGAWKVVAFLSDGHQLTGFFNSEAEGKSYFRPIIDNICVGDLIRFQAIPPHEKINMRPQTGIFKPASFTMQIRKETADITKKNFINALDGKMYKLAIKNRITLIKAKPDKIDAWILNPFVEISS